MQSNCAGRFRRLAAACAAILGMAIPGAAQLQLQYEDVSVKFGFQGQFWADWNQDASSPSGAYQQNLFMRRGRLMVGGSVGEKISFFFQTDDPNLGKTPKSLNSGFLI